MHGLKTGPRVRIQFHHVKAESTKLNWMKCLLGALKKRVFLLNFLRNRKSAAWKWTSSLSGVTKSLKSGIFGNSGKWKIWPFSALLSSSKIYLELSTMLVLNGSIRVSMVHRISHVDDRWQIIIQTCGRKEYKKSEAFITGSVLDPDPHWFWSAGSGSSRQIKRDTPFSYHNHYRTVLHVIFFSLVVWSHLRLKYQAKKYRVTKILRNRQIVVHLPSIGSGIPMTIPPGPRNRSFRSSKMKKNSINNR